MPKPPAPVCAIVGAGDFIGRAIALRFARQGYHLFLGRRNGDQLAPLKAEIEALGATCDARSLDARQEDQIAAFINDAAGAGPLKAVIFNIGANVNFPIVDTTERVFRKVWEMACLAGFLTGREAARHMLEAGEGSIFFTGATASLRGGNGFAAFASAKFGLRAVAQSMARELGPKGIHVAHLIIDAAVDTEWVRGMIRERQGDAALAALEDGKLMDPASVGETYWMLHNQPKDAWTFELDIRPFGEKF